MERNGFFLTCFSAGMLWTIRKEERKQNGKKGNNKITRSWG